MTILRSELFNSSIIEIDSEGSYPSTYSMIQKLDSSVAKYYVTKWKPGKKYYKGYKTMKTIRTKNGSEKTLYLAEVIRTNSLLEANLCFKKLMIKL
jgi:hypothetical protein